MDPVLHRLRGPGASMATSAALLALLAGTSCQRDAAAPPQTGLAPGDHEMSLVHDGLSRSYRVHVPPGSGPFPVLLALHGGGGNARQFQESTAFDARADQNGYVVVYPDGTGVLELHVWNAGNCCGAAPEAGIDDVGFTRGIVADLASKMSVDLDRVYAAGHSNGAMMAYRIGVEATDLVAAIAPYAGAMLLDPFAPTATLPVLHIHSVDDPRALYEGGLGPPFPLTGVRVQGNAVEAELDKWVAHNGCSTPPSVGATTVGAAGTISEGHTSTLHTWRPCSNGVEVRLLKLTGSGHGWPGTLSSIQSLLGPPTQIIDIEEEIWRFVSAYSR